MPITLTIILIFVIFGVPIALTSIEHKFITPKLYKSVNKTET